MNSTTEMLEGVLVDAIVTFTDADAHDQLMHRTGEFLNMLDHVARNHRGVITGGYLGEVLDDIDHLQIKHSLPQPVDPSLQ